jgi:hypothetical protein
MNGQKRRLLFLLRPIKDRSFWPPWRAPDWREEAASWPFCAGVLPEKFRAAFGAKTPGVATLMTTVARAVSPRLKWLESDRTERVRSLIDRASTGITISICFVMACGVFWRAAGGSSLTCGAGREGRSRFSIRSELDRSSKRLPTATCRGWAKTRSPTGGNRKICVRLPYPSRSA